MSLGCSRNIMHIMFSVSNVMLLPFLILDIVAWLNIFSFLILVLVYPLLDSSLSTSILYLINVFQSSFLYYIFILLWYFKTFSKSTNKNILFSLILVLTYTDISAIIMTSRKTWSKNKKPVAELPTKRQAPIKKERYADYITFGEKVQDYGISKNI